MKIGCAALYPITRYGFPYSFDDYLKALADMHSAGFAHCELEINVDLDLEEYHQRVGELTSRLQQYGLNISAIIGVVHGAFSTDPAVAERYQRRYRRLAEFGAVVRCEMLCVCAYMPPEIKGVPGTEPYPGAPPMQVRVPAGFDWKRFWDNAVFRFAQMARTSAEFGQTLIIENRVGDFVNTSDGVFKLIEDAGEPNAGCLLDVAHTHATKEHLDLVIPKLKDRLLYVHLADNDGTQPLHLPAGRGNIDFPAVFRSLKSIGYTSYANVDFSGVPPDQILAEVSRGRAYFQECLDALERE